MSAGDQVTKASVEGNELSRIDQLERDVATLRAMVISLGSLDQATENIGSVTQGEWRFKDDNDKLRMILSVVNLLAEFGIDAHWILFDLLSNPQVWASADTGKLAAGGGDVTIGDDGMVTWDHIPIEFKQYDYQLGYPAYSSFILARNAGAELNLISEVAGGSGNNRVVDGGFESGTLANFNVSAEGEIVSDYVHSGSYALHFPPAGTPHTIECVARFAVSPGKAYMLQLYTDRRIDPLSFEATINYYDAAIGGNLLKSENVITQPRATRTWQRSVGIPSFAPAGATRANILITFSGGNEIWVDDIWVRSVTVPVMLRGAFDGWMACMDGVEASLMAPWQPFAYPIHFSSTAAFTSNTTLPANGGSVAIPIQVTGLLKLASVSIRQGSSTGPREWGWDLYKQVHNTGIVVEYAENTLKRVAQSDGTDLFTPSAASVRTLAASSVVTLSPGIYWLVVQRRNATNAFALGAAVASATFSPNHCQTKTTTNPNGATLDFVAATWTKVDVIHAVRLNGIVFGQAAAF